MSEEKIEKVAPVRLTMKDGTEYVLEFSRESVKFAEQRGFDVSELTKYPQTNIPALWFYAFRKNHKNMSRANTDALLEELGGLTPDEIERLVRLYAEPNESLIVTDPKKRKNVTMTVEL